MDLPILLRHRSRTPFAVVRSAVAGLLIVALLGGGCGGDDSEKRGGRSVAEWIADAKGTDAAKRVQAYQALMQFANNPEAVAVLREAMSADAVPPSERLVAAISFFRATRDGDAAVAGIRQAIRKEADGPAGFKSTRELQQAVVLLGDKAKPLAADIAYVCDRIRGQDAQTLQQRSTLQSMVGGLR